MLGKGVLITRPKPQCAVLKKLLQKKGARVIEFPVTRILPPADWGPLDRAIGSIEDFDWIVFTSVNGVKYFFERLRRNGQTVRRLAGCRVAAIGSATRQALLRAGIRADLVPRRFTSEALAAELARRRQIRGRRFLLARTDIAPGFLKRRLKELGGKVTQVTAYRTAPGKGDRRRLRGWLRTGKVDFVVFTSSAAVRNFFDAAALKKGSCRPPRLISIGPVTSRALKSCGCRPFAEARVHTMAGVAEAVLEAAEETGIRGKK